MIFGRGRVARAPHLFWGCPANEFAIRLTNDDAYRGELFDFLIGGTQRGESNLLRELCEAGIGQQWHVSQQLVDGITARWRRRKGNQLVSVKQLGDT